MDHSNKIGSPINWINIPSENETIAKELARKYVKEAIPLLKNAIEIIPKDEDDQQAVNIAYESYKNSE